MNTKILELAGTGLSLGGVALSHKVLGAAWTRITGDPPPAKNPDPDEAWTGIIIWSLVTGLVGTVIKVAISRQVAKMENQPRNNPKASSQAEV
ncbi:MULTISPECIES: DUF4235 domain-containing protein [Kocuria]|uniref:DUF4235 domain-containing protein n=1 Tax=Kocuria oceani TaxID=988827 RepID=A0ABV9TIA1_9MICC|nr:MULTISPECIES: DUF4235 domain-containing protein [Kocuria]KLU08773.1 hypothetical protein ABL57_15870 [Kocuria sp. SM24M-10]OLT03296.1 hypothetical protein BJF77_05075 [Kocuria sp. CNJ-770]